MKEEERKEKVIATLVDVFEKYSQCINSQIDNINKNWPEEDKSLFFSTPFEKLSSHIETLCRAGAKIIELLGSK